MEIINDPEWLRGALTQAADGELVLVQVLLAAGADPNGMPLIMATQCGELEIVRAMITAGAEVNRIFADTTPLIRAITSFYPEIVQEFVVSGANVNQPAPNGEMPLDAARTANHRGVTLEERQTIIQILQRAGAKPSSSDDVYSYTA